jgi:RHS repeat-associated protein
MRLTNAQRDALAASTMDNVRRQRFLELSQRGFDVKKDPANDDLIIQDAAGGFARVESLGLRTRVTSAEGRTTETEQYPNGRIRRIVDASGREVSFERDAGGFLKSIDRGPGGGIYRFELSPEWYPLLIEYPDGTSVRTKYSAPGVPIEVTQRDGTKIAYEYSPEGRLTSLTDPQGHRTRLSDPGPGASRVIKYPNGDRHEYVDDINANLLRFDVNGQEHAFYQHNPASDSLDVRYRDGSREHFVFSNGRIIEATNQHSTVKLTYDDAGRLLSEDTDGRIVRYLRNEVGALIGIVTPEGEKLSYTRDRDQRLIGITDWAGGRYEMELPPTGPPTKLRYPNGLIISTQTNTMGLPSSWALIRPIGRGHRIDEASWEHDTCDRLVSATRNGQRLDYRYDKASRLTEVRCSDQARSERFELDPSGNRIQSAGSRCEYDPMNRLIRQGSRSFQYDGQGNQIADFGGQQPCYYRYNGRGQLIEIRMRGKVIEYAYDPLGRRIHKTVDGVTTRFQWAGTQLLSEITEGIQIVRRDYLFCPEFLTPLAFREGSSVYYMHCGRLQEPLCVTDRAGEVVWKTEYLAFGRALISVGRLRQSLRLPGQYYDDETGLHYAVARYYAPDLGRYLSMDPLRVLGASLNYYTYCDGDPVNRVDPTGEIGPFLVAVAWGVGIGMVAGAVIGAGVELYRQHGNGQPTDWGQVGLAAGIGACLGGIGGAVFVTGAAAAAMVLGVAASGMVAGAIGGGLAGGVVYCVEAAGKGEWDSGDFATSVVVGAGLGAVTAGIGGIFARRAAQAAEEAAAGAPKPVKPPAPPEPPPPEPPPPEPPVDPAVARQQRLQELGTDPRNGQFRQAEADAAARLEQRVGPLKRDPTGDGDWIDANGNTYDAVGPAPPKHVDTDAFNAAIDDHLLKQGLDKVVVDTTGMTPAQQAAVEQHIAGLPEAQQNRIIIQGN